LGLGDAHGSSIPDDGCDETERTPAVMKLSYWQ
jgi:hypothetical protein